MRPEPSHSSQPLRGPNLPLIHPKVMRNFVPERLLYQSFEIIPIASKPLVGTLEYGDSVRQVGRLKDAAMRKRPARSTVYGLAFGRWVGRVEQIRLTGAIVLKPEITPRQRGNSIPPGIMKSGSAVPPMRSHGTRAHERAMGRS